MGGVESIMYFYKNLDNGDVFEYTALQVSEGRVLPFLTPMTEEEVALHCNPPVDIEKLKSVQKDLINKSRTAAENAEFTFEFDDVVWDGGLTSKQRLRETIDGMKALGDIPDGFYWTSADNVDVEINSISQLEDLFTAMSAEIVRRGFDIHQIQRSYKQRIEEATTAEEIKSIVWEM